MSSCLAWTSFFPFSFVFFSCGYSYGLGVNFSRVGIPSLHVLAEQTPLLFDTKISNEMINDFTHSSRDVR